MASKEHNITNEIEKLIVRNVQNVQSMQINFSINDIRVGI